MRWKRPNPRPETYWKPWFAWFPVKLETSGETVWLEWVWRHVDPYSGAGETFYFYRYRDDIHWGGANLEHRE